ncbi:hypothetical protein RI054_21g92460 [Pseudoscourfieldia marina]
MGLRAPRHGCINKTFNINFGTDVEELKRRAAEFLSSASPRSTARWETWRKTWATTVQKGFYGVAMQAIVDAKPRFLWRGFAAGCTNDVHAFGMTQLAEALQKGILPAGFWLAGDEAYVCTDSLIVPYSSSSRVYATNASCDDFNFYLSRIRITVERAFGVLVGVGHF